MAHVVTGQLVVSFTVPDSLIDETQMYALRAGRRLTDAELPTVLIKAILLAGLADVHRAPQLSALTVQRAMFTG